jgi:hypothetical protein
MGSGSKGSGGLESRMELECRSKPMESSIKACGEMVNGRNGYEAVIVILLLFANLIGEGWHKCKGETTK